MKLGSPKKSPLIFLSILGKAKNSENPIGEALRSRVVLTHKLILELQRKLLLVQVLLLFHGFLPQKI